MSRSRSSISHIALLLCSMVLAVIGSVFGDVQAGEADLSIRFDRSAIEGHEKIDKAWVLYALPVGNGSIGAMVFGGVERERVQFTEESLWTGGPGSAGWLVNPNRQDGFQGMQEIRKTLVIDEEPKQAEDLSHKYLQRTGEDNKSYGNFQPFGDLLFDTDVDPTSVSDYQRQLDLSTGLASVSFACKGAVFQREVFGSFPDRCVVMHFTADKPGLQTVRLSMESPHSVRYNVSGKVLISDGSLKDNGLKMEARVGVVHRGGTVTTENGTIQVSHADSVTFILVAGTDYAPVHPHYRGEKPAKLNALQLSKAMKTGFTELRTRHLKDHQSLFNRVAIDLGVTPADVRTMSTDVRLENYRKDDAVDPGLEALLFQYGRYLLIASSRPGSLPANLQGVWNNRTSPPWRSDYHLNINVQMNYWPAGPCNLLECQEPLIDYIDHLRTPGADTAKAYHNARGWTANLCGNIWGYTCMNYTEHKRKPIFWTYFPLGGAWLATHAYEHYAFGGDKDYLDKRLWPILSSQADFLVDYHYTLPDGTLASTPSWSPEHGPISWGATFDHAAAKEALRGAIRVAAELGETGPRIMAWKETLAKIVPYKVGKHGQLQEWYEDIDSPTDKHRHVNHLFGLHPGSQITFANSPDLIKACKTTLAQRGDSGTGWSLAWKINFWARLHDGNHAHVLVKRLLRKNIHPNFFDTHPPFQIDGNFGATAGIAEMLLQSHEHDPTGNPIIRLLPALPSAWPSGKVTGLRARGGSELDIQWKDGKLASVTVRANQPGTVVIRYGELTKRLKLVSETTQTLNSDLAPRGGKQ